MFTLALSLGQPASGRAQTVSLNVDNTQTVRVVDERVFGANSVIWDPQASSAQTVSMLQAAGVRTLRMPGGSLSDEYHWNLNRSLSNTWTWATSFNGFVQLIAATNVQPFVTVNYGSGTPEEAAGLVAYLNAPASLQGTSADVTLGIDSGSVNWQTAGYWSAVRAASPLAVNDGFNFLRIGRAAPVAAKYWEIGNECYGTWETDLQSVTHDPTTYANRVQAYVAKMKAVDPTIKTGVVVVTSGENGGYKNWTPVMLARLKTLGVTPDFVIYHSYPQAPGNESDTGLLQQAHSWAGIASDLRQQLTTYLGTAGAGVEIVVTENNSVFSNPGKQSTSVVNGLYLADSIANVMQTEINAFMWWAVRNGTPTNTNGTVAGNMSSTLYGWRQYGDYGMISTALTGANSGNYEGYPTYYMMKLLSHFARGGDTVVPATSNNALLSIFAVRRLDGSLSLLVLNKDPVNAQSATIFLAGFAPVPTATTYSYGKPQDTAAQTGSGSVDVATASMTVAGSTFTASFGSYSGTVISLVPAVAPSFSIQPAGQTALSGTAASFAVTAGGNPAPGLQWQVSTDGGFTWTNLGDTMPYTGSATATLAVNPVVGALSGNQYRCVATNGAGSVSSNPAALAVTKLAQTITFAGPAGQAFSATPITLSATADSGLPVSFAVLSGPATISGNTLTLTGAGSVAVEASQAGSADYATATPVDRSFTISANFASWQQAHFTAAELLDPKVSGPAAVQGADGLANLVKYALGLDPKQNVTAGQPAAGATSTAWIYTYAKPTAVTDVTCMVEVSTDLANWSSTGVTLQMLSSAAGIETWQASYPRTSATVFFRLNVTQ